MKLIGFFLIITSNFLILWSITEPTGRLFGKFSETKRMKLVFLVSVFAIVVVSAKFLAVLAVEIVFVTYFLKKKARKVAADKLFLVDELILTMQTGFSLESALAKVASERSEFHRFVGLSQPSAVLDTKNSDFTFIKMLSFCRKNSSLSFKVLKFYREIEKLRQKLLAKEKTISLQAKAQAIVSALLYVGLFGAQLAWNPDFSKVLFTPEGKLIIAFSFILLCTGLWLVFKLSQTKNMEI